jgi:hypothetical protein
MIIHKIAFLDQSSDRHTHTVHSCANLGRNISRIYTDTWSPNNPPPKPAE